MYLKAIVIDDEKSITLLLYEILTNIGLDVVGKGQDGHEAVELYENLKPDLVFLDVLMPKYDGFYALNEIRKINPDALVIFVTADVLIEYKVASNNIVPNAVIQKPFSIEKMKKVVSYLVKASEQNHNNVESNLIQISIENTFNKINNGEFERFKQILKNDYNCELKDCLDNSDNIKKALEKIFEDQFDGAIQSIETSRTSGSACPTITLMAYSM